ncbi:small RNA 2'-O-methyltransferase [Gastrophryne carolinensis]
MESLRFTPPVCQQRYDYVISFVDTYKPKKIADLGCSECSLLHRLKFWNCIELLVGVDIDGDTLKRKRHTLTPLPAHYLEPLKRPLTVILYEGSVCEKDPALLGFDLITCIELIEHLEADDLEKLQDVLFGFMEPKLAVISTPNAEFNVLLPKTQKFRHPDHKFEWSREEFQSWALKVAKQYHYTVEFSGVGKPPPEHEEVGFCSQIGVFQKNYIESADAISIKKQYKSVYNIVLHVIYPSVKEEKYLRRAVLNAALSYAEMLKNRVLYHHMQRNEAKEGVETSVCDYGRNSFKPVAWPYSLEDEEQEQNDGNNMTQPFMQKNTIHVPLQNVFSNSKVKELCGSLDVLRNMITGEVTLSEDGMAIVYPLYSENDFDLEEV